MQKYQNVVQYSNGTVAAGAQVNVVTYPGGVACLIYDASGVVTPNPVFTDAEGRFEFYAPDGHYSLVISGVALATYTIEDILLEDPADPNAYAVTDLTMQADSIVYNDDGNYGWNDYVSDIFVVGPNAAYLTALFSEYYQYEFVQGQDRDCQANFHILHDYALGSPLYPHFHITTTSNASGTVRIGIQYSYAKRSDSLGAMPFSTPVTLYVNYPIPANSALMHMVVQVDDLNTIPGTNVEPDTVLMVRYFRNGTDPADTFPDSIWGFKADLHYQASRFTTKNRDPDFFA